MLTSIVIVSFVALLIGMAISVAAFGTGGKRSKVFQDIYFSVEDVDGIGVVYTKMGEYSAILRMTNPVKKFSADVDSYYQFTSLLGSVIETLGEGYALHKQDIFVRRRFSKSAGEGAEQDDVRYLTAAYFRAFEGREYIDNDTYLVITQESRKNSLLSYDNARWKDFLLKIQKVYDLLHDGGVRVRFLDSRLARLYIDRFFAVNFRDKVFSMTDFKVDSEHILMGDRQCKMYSLLDVDNVGLPGFLRPYADMTVNNTVMPVDLMADLDQIPGVETVVYNQVFFLPNQKRELSLLEKKKNRHASIPNPGNAMAAEDIKKVQEVIARESRQLVYAHYNLLVSIPSDGDMQKVTNYLENSFSRRGIHISKRAYNQLELFIASFPGNVFRLNQDYDRFLTLSDAAMCLTYKECPTKGDTGKNFPHCYYTDRDGVPMAVDITGKEADIRRTDNSNFFALGPSGSGKSFFMNTVVRQLYEQNTDIVIVDTGDSYEMLCQQFGGTYISYSKESPISMNPFKVSRLEYEENFVEKKDFLKSLIFLIFKGAGEVSKIEEYIIEKTIMEYYREYFTPFKGYSDQERKELHDALVITAQSNGEFDDFEERLNVANGTGRY
ncbi:MAG: DUF87 domain-containing protein, partial [Bacteroidales bacterium]|nr:DUF87 domain-containing protein [Bacteroidales bacterium]